MEQEYIVYVNQMLTRVEQEVAHAMQIGVKRSMVKNTRWKSILFWEPFLRVDMHDFGTIQTHA